MKNIINVSDELRREREDWDRLTLESFARAYSDNEPEYTLADVKPVEKRTTENKKDTD